MDFCKGCDLMVYGVRLAFVMEFVIDINEDVVDDVDDDDNVVQSVDEDVEIVWGLGL